MVLFLFVVLVLDVKKAVSEKLITKHKFAVHVAVLIMGIEMLILIITSPFHKMLIMTGSETTVKSIGEILFTKYLLPFELVSIVLLVSIVGAIVLTKTEKRDKE